jgi:hypothetical protein
VRPRLRGEPSAAAKLTERGSHPRRARGRARPQRAGPGNGARARDNRRVSIFLARPERPADGIPLAVKDAAAPILWLLGRRSRSERSLPATAPRSDGQQIGRSPRRPVETRPVVVRHIERKARAVGDPPIFTLIYPSRPLIEQH